MGLTVVAFFALGLDRWLTFAEIRARHEQLATLFTERPLAVGAAYVGLYVSVTSLSLPGAALLTLLAGAVFGLGWGVVVVSFASGIGATLAFLSSRYLFRDLIATRFARQMRAVDRGIVRDGPFYLFSLRLIPVFPFFVLNLLMGLTAMPVLRFWWVSQLGMLLGTVVYVNLGTRLAAVDSLAGVLSPALIASFAALAALPFAARGIARAHRRALGSGGRRAR